MADGADAADAAAVADTAGMADAARVGALAASQPALTTAIDTVTAIQNQTPDAARDERTMSSSSMWIFIHERGIAADRLDRDQVSIAFSRA